MRLCSTHPNCSSVGGLLKAVLFDGGGSSDLVETSGTKNHSYRGTKPDRLMGPAMELFPESEGGASGLLHIPKWWDTLGEGVRSEIHLISQFNMVAHSQPWMCSRLPWGCVKQHSLHSYT